MRSSRYLFFGGPYSNLQALQALREIATNLRLEPEQIVCTGDLVGYCASPAEVIREIKDWGIQSIYGNVDEQLFLNKMDCGCNYPKGGVCDSLSQSWFKFIQDNTGDQEKQWLATLPAELNFGYKNLKIKVTHGTPDQINQFVFPSTKTALKDRYFADRTDLIVAGHSGIPFLQRTKQGIWLNAGVIGMPANDGETTGWYALLENDFIQLRSFRYQHFETAKAMQERNLPSEYINTIQTGLWHSCEILPEEERNLQGEKIETSGLKL